MIRMFVIPFWLDYVGSLCPWDADDVKADMTLLPLARMTRHQQYLHVSTMLFFVQAHDHAGMVGGVLDMT